MIYRCSKKVRNSRKNSNPTPVRSTSMTLDNDTSHDLEQYLKTKHKGMYEMSANP